MRELADGYSVEVDTVDKDSWHRIIQAFDDANLYQTWSYDEIRCGRNSISHLILKKNDRILAAAQARIVKIPIINSGIAYIRWGPMWKISSSEVNVEIFSQAIRALRNEYACRRGLVLRIYPVLFSDESDIYIPLLEQEGFAFLQKGMRDRTLLIDLTPPLDALRKGLNQKWRNCLNRAERNALELLEGNNDEMYEMFISIYGEMLERKRFIEPNDINEFRLIQQDLPDNIKMKILLCRFEGKLCTGAIFSAMGNTGIYLFGATNDVGMKSNGSYLLQWRFIELLKENHFTCYDLNGINPEINPGTYNFKEGLRGKNGKDVYFLGQFDAVNNTLSSFTIKYGDILKSNYGKFKEFAHNIRYQK
jgi:lipid II:glycine glycyltransferase (peptidoglycan interpeptide bridge formation enzyme)